MTFNEQFLSILREQNQERGWQQNFAREAGINQSALSKIISGETRDPGLSIISAILDALHYQLSKEQACGNCRRLEEEILILEQRVQDLEKKFYKEQGKADAYLELLNKLYNQPNCDKN